MRNLVKYAIAAVVAFSVAQTSIYADDGFEYPTSQAVVEDASTSLISYMKTVQELISLAPTLPTRDITFDYIYILDDLAVISKRLNIVNTIGADPLERLSDELAKHSLQWLNFTKDSEETLRTVIRWSQADTLSIFVNTQMQYIPNIKTKEEAIRLYSLWGRLIQLVESKPSGTTAMNVAMFQDFQSLILGKALASGQKISHDHLKQIIVNLKSAQGFQEIVGYMRTRTYSAQTVDELKSIIYLNLLLGDTIQKAQIFLPNYVSSTTRESLADAFNKLIRGGGKVDYPTIDRLFSRLEPGQIDYIGSQLSQTPIEVIRDEQVEFVETVGKKIIKIYTNFGMLNRKEDLSKYIARLAVRRLSLKIAVDGAYKVVMAGKTYDATILRTSPSSLAISFVYQNVVAYSLFHVGIIEGVGSSISFEGTRFEPTTFGNSHGSATNYTIRFQFADGGRTISGTFDNGDGFVPFQGQRFTTFSDSLSVAGSPQHVNGTYTGMMNGDRVQIAISAAGSENSISASLIVDPNGFRAQTPLNIGYYNKKNGSVILTSGETNLGNYIQVRGFVKGNQFIGDYIVGGVGTVYKLNLVRQ